MSSTTTNSPTLNQVITRLVDSKMRAQGGALPGTVQSFDASSDTCVVRPGVHRIVPTIEGDFAFEELPVIYNVPVCWPQGRNFKIEGALQAGDPVLLVCLDRDASGWLRSGKPSEPDDMRESSWANAVAIPGLVPSPNPFPPILDSAALASKMDQFLRAISALADTVAPNSAETATLAIIQAARALVGGAPGAPGIGTVGSTVLKTTG